MFNPVDTLLILLVIWIWLYSVVFWDLLGFNLLCYKIYVLSMYPLSNEYINLSTKEKKTIKGEAKLTLCWYVKIPFSVGPNFTFVSLIRGIKITPRLVENTGPATPHLFMNLFSLT